MMVFKRYENDGCLSYLIGCNETLECLIIDPHLDVGPYIQDAEDMDMTITYALDTHSHADHMTNITARTIGISATAIRE